MKRETSIHHPDKPLLKALHSSARLIHLVHPELPDVSRGVVRLQRDLGLRAGDGCEDLVHHASEPQDERERRMRAMFPTSIWAAETVPLVQERELKENEKVRRARGGGHDVDDVKVEEEGALLSAELGSSAADGLCHVCLGWKMPDTQPWRGFMEGQMQKRVAGPAEAGGASSSSSKSGSTQRPVGTGVMAGEAVVRIVRSLRKVASPVSRGQGRLDERHGRIHRHSELAKFGGEVALRARHGV